MRKNLGRKEARQTSQEVGKRRGDLDRLSTHQLRTHDGMVSSGKFKRTPNGLVAA